MNVLFNQTERAEIRGCRRQLATLRTRIESNKRKSLILTVRALTMLARDTIWRLYLSKSPVAEQPRERVEGLLSIT